MKRAILTLLLFVLTIGAPAQAESPILYRPSYELAGEKMEKLRISGPIATCKEMPAEDVKAVQAWLNNGSWKKGHGGIPGLRMAGVFIFMKGHGNEAWAITVLANRGSLMVDSGAIDAKGDFVTHPHDPRSIDAPAIALMLVREVERYYPEGKILLDDYAAFLRDAERNSRKGQTESK